MLNEERRTPNEEPASLPPDVVVSVRHVSKKFCRNLRRSMIYGMQDLSRNMFGLTARGSSFVVPRSSSAGNQEPRTKNQEPPPLRRDEFWALQDINFELRRGECLGLIGVNGSGKTTLLRLLTGIFPPDEGEIVVRGRVGALIALGAGFHPHMTGRENIYLNGSILGLSQCEINAQFQQIVDFAEIGEFIDSPVSTYSSGMRVRLGFAVATAVHPDLLLIDEVLAVGDIAFRAKCFNAVNDIARHAAVIFVSHSMPDVARVASRLLLLHNGACATDELDVAKGIDTYFSLLPSSTTKVVVDGDTVQSLVVHVNAADPDGQTLLPSIRYLSDLIIDIAFKLDPAVRGCAITFSFFDKTYSIAAQCSSWGERLPISNRDGGVHAKVRIPKLPLAPGVYSVTVNVGERGTDGGWGRTLARCDAVTAFQIVGSPIVPHAAVLFQGEWMDRVATS